MFTNAIAYIDQKTTNEEALAALRELLHQRTCKQITLFASYTPCPATVYDVALKEADMQRVDELNKAEAEQRLQAIASQIRWHDVAHHIVVQGGVPEALLASHTRTIGADLLVLPRKERKGFFSGWRAVYQLKRLLLNPMGVPVLMVGGQGELAAGV
jgi:hypothetical protein